MINENIAQKEELRISNERLLQLNDTLTQERNKLEFWKESVSSYNDSLSRLVKLLENSESNIQLSSETERILEASSNAKYSVTLYSLNPEPNVSEKISKYLINQGYSLAHNSILYERTSWLATKSSVLYYSEDSEDKARSIARELNAITGIDFAIQRGAGLGVIKGQERWTFFIHYINQ